MGLHCIAKAEAMTNAAKKKCTAKLECPLMPNLTPRKASRNLSFHRRLLRCAPVIGLQSAWALAGGWS